MKKLFIKSVSLFMAMILLVFSCTITGHAANKTYFETVKDDVPIWSSSSSKSTKLRTVDKEGTVLISVGSTTNSSGNLWYQLEDGSWVFSGNVRAHSHKAVMCGIGGVRHEPNNETSHKKITNDGGELCSCGYVVVEAKITTKLDPHVFNSKGVCKYCNQKAWVFDGEEHYIQTTKADAVIRKDFYEVADKIKTVNNTGTVLIAVKSEINSYGNLWFKLRDGGWIYSGNVEKHEHSVSQNSKINTYFEQNDEYTHFQVTTDSGQTCYCGYAFSSPTTSRQKVNHSFDSNGYCVHCGYSREHEHIGIVYGENSIRYERGDATAHNKYTNYSGLRCECGYIITPATESVTSEHHDFDNSGRCRQCGYTKATEFVCIVHLDANGGKVRENSIEYAFSKFYGDLPTPTREGYSFSGWYTAREGGNKVGSMDRVDSSHTLYAHWKSKTFTVYFEAKINGGTTSSTCIEVTYGQTYMPVPQALPTASKAGYNFIGWYTEPYGGDHITEATIVKIADDHVLYAQFEKIYVERIEYSSSSLTLRPDAYVDLSEGITIYPENASTKTLSWNSSDPSVVSVDSNGRVVAHKNGSAQISIASTDGSNVIFSLPVNVGPYTSYDHNGTIYTVFTNALKPEYRINQTSSIYSEVFNNYGCCASCYAMGLSIMFDKQHDPTRYINPSTGYTSYLDGHICSTLHGDESTVYAVIYENIFKELPSMIHYDYSVVKSNGNIRNSQHWVLIIGLRDGASSRSLKPSDFLVIDPTGGHIRTLDEAHNFHGRTSVSVRRFC